MLATLAGLAADDENHARLRDTLLAFLHANGSYKATAEQLMLHKNTVQYRIRRAEESLGRPVSENPHDLELALRASHWLGSSVLKPARTTALRAPARQPGWTRLGRCRTPRSPTSTARAAGPAMTPTRCRAPVRAGRPCWPATTCGRSASAVSPGRIAGRPADLWRYHELLPVRQAGRVVSLGEGMTPLLPMPKIGPGARRAATC